MFSALKTCSRLLTVFILAFLFCETIADVYESVEDPEAEAFGNRVCTNKECAQYAAMFIHNGNEKINPCEDFGAYACENYKMHHDDENNYQEANSLIDRQLKELLAEPESPNDKPWHKLTKSYYQKCLNTTIDQVAIWKMLHEIGGWPILKVPQWPVFTSSYEEYLADIHKKYPVSLLFQPEVITKRNTSDEKILLLKPGDDTVLMPSLLMLLAPEALDDLQIVMDFDEKRKKLFAEAGGYARCGPLRLMAATNFDIQKYVHRLYEGIAPVNENMTVCYKPLDYFDKLHTLLQYKSVFANYAGSLVLHHGMRLLVEQALLHKHREDLCTRIVSQEVLVEPVTQMYAEKHFELDAFAPKITEMVTLMKEELAELINEASWLDDPTRKNALNKLDKMKLSVGAPENMFNDTYFEENWNITFDSLENFIQLDARIARKRIAVHLSEINQPLNLDNWLRTRSQMVYQPLRANAHYWLSRNKVHIQFGILQPPFYDPNVPDYINFAAIGQVVAHEIMHGFDKDGRLYDANGYDIDWWTNETANHYVSKTDCYKKQYNDEGVNGELSMGENIADNIGMKIAYRAYKKMMTKRGGPAEPALPTFEKFSLDQMFFIANANRGARSQQQ